MNISYNLLKKYIDIDVPAEKTAELLTSTGLEVEGTETRESIPGGLKGVVIGKVLTCEAHPNADKLKLTTVDVGKDEPLRIVCGAPNAAAGQYVVVATVGAEIYPIEGDPFKIKKAKIRGERSEGMICAEDEIGLGASHDGIMILDDQPAPGTPAKDYFHVETNTVFEIGLTPNRADAASHIGTARDLKALTAVHKDLNCTELKLPDVSDFKTDNQNLNIEVEVENPEACPRYSGVTLTNIKVGSSPEYIQNTLRSIGLEPINNIVDITNFVLHETGQPLHAFDADKIKGNKVRVRTLPQKTSFTTLDEKERELNERDLMICNETDPMCMAGVFGGIDSGVKESTTSVFLESAYFDPVWIRKTAKRHGLNTDASFRYERGTDPNITVYALKRAALLMKEIAGAEISSEIVDVYPEPVEDFEVTLRFDRLNRIAGKKLDPDTVVEILHRLEIKVEKVTGEAAELKVPPYRVDVQREIDVVEEVMRIYGFDRIAAPEKLSASLSSAPDPDPEKVRDHAADVLAGAGFMEGMSNSLTKSGYYDDADTTVHIANPLSSELDVMRKTLIYNAAEAVQFNRNRRVADIKLFEFGRVYSMKNGKPKERDHLCMTVTGSAHPEAWNTTDVAADFSLLKGAVELLLKRFGIDQFNVQYRETENPYFESGLALTVNKKHIADLGKLNDSLKKQFSLRSDVYVAEWNWTAFLALTDKVNVRYKPVPKYPEVRRDLALILDKKIKFSEVEEIAEKTEKKMLRNVNLFDVYEGKNIEKSKKSYAVSFVFRDDTKTLTDKKVDKVMEKLLNNFKNQLGAELRK